MVKRPKRGFGHPPPSSAQVKENRYRPLLSLWAFIAGYSVNFTLLYLYTSNSVMDVWVEEWAVSLRSIYITDSVQRFDKLPVKYRNVLVDILPTYTFKGTVFQATFVFSTYLSSSVFSWTMTSINRLT